MNSMDADRGIGLVSFLAKRYTSVFGVWLIVLRYLVTFWKIWLKVMLAIKL